LTDVNLHFIREINKYLEINTEIRFSSEFQLAEEKNESIPENQPDEEVVENQVN
jgi:hypothetical protein